MQDTTRVKKTPKSSETTISQMVMAQHINGVESVFGGVVLSWADMAAAISAQKFSERMVVTASIDRMNFLYPIKLGWIVTIAAKINASSRTSCEAGVKITSLNPVTGDTYHNCTGYFTMVAIDDQGRPVIVPLVSPQTPEDQRRYNAACDRRNARIKLRKNIVSS